MTVLWAGLAMGALYALIAALFNIGVAQAGTFNFAAPQMVMVGAFATYELSDQRGTPIVVLLVLCMLVGAALGALVEVAAIRPLNPGGHGALVTTVGAAFALEGLAFVIWGPDTRSVDVAGASTVHTWFGGRISNVDIMLILFAIVAIAGLHLMSRRTRWGLVGRAATADGDAAALRGINVSLNRTVAFAVTGALGGLVGVLASLKIYAGFDLGMLLLVYAFAALTLGGMGSYVGCLAGGLVVGLIQAYTSRYLGSTYGLSVVFAVLLAVLLVRPSGLFGHKSLRVV